jgi:predicted dehydrogenase
MLKVLVIGYGSIGKRHIENLSKLKNVEIIVCTKRKPDQFLKQKKCLTYLSLNDCIKENPKFAIIANETNFHIKNALYLAKAGIHMLIEKPLSNSLVGSTELLNITKKNKLIVLVGCNFRFHPSLILMKKIISDGNLGRIISAQIENGSFLPDWHPYDNYKKNYASRNDLGGGVVLTCIHEIDYLYWFFGNVSNVFSITDTVSDIKIQADDLSAIILKFENNVVAEAHLDYFQQPSTRNCKIIGTKGTLIWNLEKNIVKQYDIKNKKWITQLKLKNYNINTTYQEEIIHLIECIDNRKKPINDLKQAIYTLKIALAIKKSSKLKKTLSIRK